MKLDKLIGTGAQAKVYLYEDYAIKVFESNYDKISVFYETLIASIIENTALPVPKVYEVLNINNQLAIKMDYLKGESLMQCLQNDAENIQAYIDKMVKIQVSIHSRNIVLPITLRDRLKEKIEGNTKLSESKKDKVLKLLKDLPDGNELCHGDFHGYNILLDGDKYSIIDWVDASVGCSDGDACRTYLLYKLYGSELAEVYLNTYCKETGKSKELILAWLPVLAATRLSENIENEEEKLMAMI
ncbi:phosphotransferase family protein [Clostridium manihotivorum]|uniref:Aminoglycoside phosphotransferase n=1 Tax=Clostridium manihotivorum TaxID=2320868 RepID=A0A3R5TFX1_9CLOT|nr:phosphotransferase [Clostridium manihotivorum]QAA32506.1 aminoglycoside phosphotransferase [Clostridium manihotivorum]